MWYEKHTFGTASSELYSDNEDDTVELEGLERYTHLLHAWARSIARLRGLRVANLTTAFADGKALEAIVDAYLPHSPTISSSSSSSRASCKLSLAAKLHSAGCSAAFTNLFSSTPALPSRDFTISTLAFLASRLLPAARAARAAATIQAFWRVCLARRTVSRRVALMRVAAHCALIVRTRERLVRAAVVLQRAWKGVLEARRERLERDVVNFQSLWRGAVVRRTVRGWGVGRGKVRERRARGGW
jgi:abnormal spindle-like microcephaly-associated protein